MAEGGVDLRNAEEVQEYVDNLGIEYRFGCYSEKNPKACQLLGEYLESITREISKAFQIFESNCVDNNHGPSCNKAGYYKITGNEHVSKDPDLGYKYLLKGCEQNFGKSCYLAGEFHRLRFKDQTVQTEQSLVKAIELFEKACDLDIPKGCANAGGLQIKRINGLKKDQAKAAKLFEKGCDLGSLPCCHNLSVMYRKGDGVPEDASKAEKYMQKAQDIHEQTTKEKERIKFQEGVETAGRQPVQPGI